MTRLSAAGRNGEAAVLHGVPLRLDLRDRATLPTPRRAPTATLVI